MTKQINWLYSNDGSTSYIGLHMSVSLMSRLSDDNPRKKGFKLLTIDTGSNDVNPNFAKMERHYAAPNGHWQKRDGELWIYEPEADVPFSEENLERAAKFYSRFVRVPTLRDRVVVPVGPDAVELMKAINEKPGYELRELENLDELTGFQSGTGKLMIKQYPTIDELMAAPR